MMLHLEKLQLARTRVAESMERPERRSQTNHFSSDKVYYLSNDYEILDRLSKTYDRLDKLSNIYDIAICGILRYLLCSKHGY